MAARRRSISILPCVRDDSRAMLRNLCGKIFRMSGPMCGRRLPFSARGFQRNENAASQKERKSPPCSSTHSIAAMWNGKTKTMRQTTASAIHQIRICPIICISISPLCACLKKLRSAARRIRNPHRCDTSGHSIYRPTGSHSPVARVGTYSRCPRILPTNLSTGVLCGSISSRPPSGPIK